MSSEGKPFGTHKTPLKKYEDWAKAQVPGEAVTA